MNKLCSAGCLTATVLLLAGCIDMDPYARPGMWQPSGANSQNLVAMVAKPNDLIRGRGTTGTPGIEGTPPVTRFWAGKQIQLPSTSSQAAGAGQTLSDTTGSSAGVGGAAAAAAAN
jgi:hypothetical protein